MDPFTVAAIAAPVVAGALMPRPGVPGYMGRQKFMTPEEERYYNEYLQSAFSPQSQLQMLASQQAQSNMAAQLARMGLGGSSLAISAQAANQADLANKFLERELARRKMGMDAIYNKAQTELGIGNSMRQSAMDKYEADMAAKKAMLGGIGSAAGMYVGYQGRQNIADQLAANRGAFMNAMYPPAPYFPEVQYGAPVPTAAPTSIPDYYPTPNF